MNTFPSLSIYFFFHVSPWGNKYIEREGKEYFSLSFHILFFPFFPIGKNGVGTPPYNFTLFDYMGITYHYPATRTLKFSEMRTTN